MTASVQIAEAIRHLQIAQTLRATSQFRLDRIMAASECVDKARNLAIEEKAKRTEG